MPAKAVKRPATFEDVLVNAPEPTRGVAVRLRELVLNALPGVVENVYGGGKVRLALYSAGGPGKVVCGIQVSGDNCLLYLHHVAAADCPALTLEGQGKHAKHVKVSSAILQAPALREAIRKAHTRATGP